MGRARGGAQKFNLWIRRQSGPEFKKYMQRVHRKTHLQLVDGLVADTPVGNPDLWKSPPPKGYSGGRAKGNWQSSVGRPRGGETGKLDKGGSPTIAANASAVQRIPAFGVSYITNNVPYIVRLNRSPQWSKQQTPGWFERNIQRVKRQFR